MLNTDFDTENIIAVTEANLRDEQKQAMAKAMEEYKQLCLKSLVLQCQQEQRGDPKGSIADAYANHF